MTGLYLPSGSTATGIFDVVITPESAGWGYSSLRVLTVPPGQAVTFSTGGDEMVALPLSGSCRVTVDGDTLALAGRAGVFDGVTDFAYLPTGSEVQLDSDAGAVVSLPGARTTRRLPFRYGPASGVPVELRGAGSCSRQVNNFAVPHPEPGTAFETDKLIACEVLTPAGNWSSYPPHKHDEASATESKLEEIYFYALRARVPVGAGVAPSARGAAYQQVYGTADRPIEVLEEIADGDVVLIPHGWHGPAIASPSHDLYYLNVMAGPSADRAWLISDDPDHGWVRETWVDQPVDPRLPFYSGAGRVAEHRTDAVRGRTRMTQTVQEQVATTGAGTVRLTVGQAVVRFLGHQYSERDGVRRRFFAGCFGIFGHGNVAGIGQALLQAELDEPGLLPYHQGRNEQAMVHIAVGYARQQDRLETFAVTASVGPGAANMLTGAALATVNRIPVLLLPADIFATRVASPVLQELEQPYGYDVSVNDAFRPLSKFFDRVWRPEQLPAALLGAMRVLTDPAETGAATIALPEDVQAEAHDWPAELFADRVWRIGRPVPEPEVIAAAATLIRSASRPMIVAGGGVTYAEANDELRAFVDATGIPIGETQAGKGSLPYDHPLNAGAVGATGTTAANEIAGTADLIIGIGTRYSDFTTASRTAFAHPGVRFVNINVAGMDAVKHAGLPVVADAKRALPALQQALAGYRTDADYQQQVTHLAGEWDARVVASHHNGHGARTGVLAQSEVLGAVEAAMDPRDVVVCAAGSLPGDLHGMWRTRERKGYHVEYGFSCMGYEIPGGIGIAMAAPDRDVFVTMGDGSYLMMPTELVTAVQEGIKIIVVLLQNNGYASIGALSESLGTQRYGTKFRYRSAGSGRLDGGVLPVDLAANAESLGVTVYRATTLAELQDGLARAKAGTTAAMVHVDTDLYEQSPAGDGWWDVPVAEVSTIDSTRQARVAYEKHRLAQRPYIAPAT